MPLFGKRTLKLPHRALLFFKDQLTELCSSLCRGHGGAVVTRLPPISKVGGSNPGLYVEKLEVAYRWSAVYSTKP